jgi:hypothetical protein
MKTPLEIIKLKIKKENLKDTNHDFIFGSSPLDSF